MISNTRVLSPTKVNELRFGYITLANFNSQELSGIRNVVAELGLTFSTPDPQSWGIPGVGGPPLSLIIIKVGLPGSCQT